MSPTTTPPSWRCSATVSASSSPGPRDRPLPTPSPACSASALDAAAAYPYCLSLAREPDVVQAPRDRLARLGRWADHVAAWPENFVGAFAQQALRRAHPRSGATDALQHLAETSRNLSREALLTVLAEERLTSGLAGTLARHPQADDIVALAIASTEDVLALGLEGWRRVLASPAFQACPRARRTPIDPLSPAALIGRLEHVLEGRLDLPSGELFGPAVRRFPDRLLRFFAAATWRLPDGMDGDDVAPLLAADDPELRDLGFRLAEGIRPDAAPTSRPRPGRR